MVLRDVPAAGDGEELEPGTWYPAALAEKRTRQELGAELRSFGVTTARAGVTRFVEPSGHDGRLRSPVRAEPLQPGSSVSRFEHSLTPSVLMEPNITSDLTTKVKNPFDLTLALLRDIGW